MTGGGRRLGREISLALAMRGIDVAVHFNGSGREALDVVEECRRRGVNSTAIEADLLDDAETASLIRKARAGLEGDLTILVNNASVFEHDRIMSATLDDWHNSMSVNLKAPFFLIQEFARQVPDAVEDTHGELEQSAVVVNLIDNRVMKPTSEFATYTIAKMGLWDLTRMAAVALAPDVRVNAIGPGPTLPSKRQSREHFSRQRRGTLLKRGATPSDVVAAMNFLIDCKSVTGQFLCLDGGQNLAWKLPADHAR